MTLNTDDPTVFGRTLTEEIVSSIDELGFSPAEAATMQANAFAVAAMPDSARVAVLHEISALVREIGAGRA
jgi:adenosine deaminase